MPESIACQKRMFRLALGGERVETPERFVDETRVAHHEPAVRQSFKELTHQRAGALAPRRRRRRQSWIERD